jgi:hypothetical protein
LLGDNSVSHVNPPAFAGFVIDLFDDPHEFVTRYDIVFHIGRAGCITPEFRRALITLYVACANTHGFDPNEGFTRANLWDCNVFQGVILWTMADNCSGGCGHGLVLSPGSLLSALVCW